MNLEGNQGEEKSKQQYLSLDRVNYLVVDEADLMLDISFLLSPFCSFIPPWIQRTVEFDGLFESS